MAEKSKERTILNLLNTPSGGPDVDHPDDEQVRSVQLEGLIQQTSEQLTTLVKSMMGSIAALKNNAAPSQQNHLLVLETQVGYLDNLAHDLTAGVQSEPTNESE